MAQSIIVAGVDEAGYGPLLGPLVISATAFEVPAEHADTCLWKLLRKSVSSKVLKRGSRIPILDSKKLYQREEGLSRLECSVLSVVNGWRGLPPTLRALVGLVSPDTLEPMAGYPWYRGADPALPVACEDGSTRVRGRLFGADMEACGVRPAGLWSQVVLEGQYNRLVGSTQNKAVALFGQTLRLIARIAQTYPDRELRIFIDKQGGRDHYGHPLMCSFETRKLRIIDESPTYSAYELSEGGPSWQISFRQDGESHHLTTALASMLSKYLRELFMHCFNTWWAEQVPGVKPTAGYYGDGQRFINDIVAHLPRLGIARGSLVRDR